MTLIQANELACEICGKKFTFEHTLREHKLNQHTKRKFLNFENWTNGEVSKSAKSPNLLTFKVNFLYQKLSESFSIFFY